jgi:BolA-like protein 3
MLALRAALGRHTARAARALSASTTTPPSAARALSTSTPPPPPSATEAALEAKLRAALPGATSVLCRDSSGGCGTMYEITVAAAEFGGKSTVAAHKMVTAALKDDIAAWHGFHLTTKPA